MGIREDVINAVTTEADKFGFEVVRVADGDSATLVLARPNDVNRVGGMLTNTDPLHLSHPRALVFNMSPMQLDRYGAEAPMQAVARFTQQRKKFRDRYI